jgi:hypothetical protein
MQVSTEGLNGFCIKILKTKKIKYLRINEIQLSTNKYKQI